MKVVAAILVCFVVEAVFAGPAGQSKEFICPDKPHDKDVEYFGSICSIVAVNDYVLDASTGRFTQLTLFGQSEIMTNHALTDDCQAPLDQEDHQTANKVVERMRTSNTKLGKFADLFMINTHDSIEKLNPAFLDAFLSSLEKNNIQGVIITPYLEISVADTVKLLPELTKALKNKNMQVYFAAPAVKGEDLTDDVVQKMKLCDKIIMKTTKVAAKNNVHYDAPLDGRYTYTIKKTVAAYLAKGFGNNKLVGALSLDGARYDLDAPNDIEFASFSLYCDLFSDESYGWSTDKKGQCFYGHNDDEWVTVEIPKTLDAKSEDMLSWATGGIALYGSLDNDGWESRCGVDRYALVTPIVNNFGKCDNLE